MSAVSFAQTERISRARALFKEGVAHAAEDRWDEARQAFQASSKLLAHAGTTYNLGYCERGLGHHTRARLYFMRALDEDKARGGELSEEQRSATTEYLAEANAAIARITVTLPSTARFSVDGRPLVKEGEEWVAGIAPKGPPERVGSQPVVVLVDPGERVFEISDAGRRDRRVVRVQPGERRLITLAFAALRREGEVDPAVAEREDTRRIHLGGALIMGGVAAILGVVAGVLSSQASSSWSEAQDACPEPTRCPDDRGFNRSNRASFEARLATVAWVTAGAAAAGGIVLWATTPAPLDQDVASAGVSLRGSF